MSPDLAAVDQVLGTAAPLPRDTGELVFEEPWQGRALAMGIALLQRTGASWEDFRRHLVPAIAATPQDGETTAATAYYSAWLTALDALLAERGLLDPAARR